MPARHKRIKDTTLIIDNGAFTIKTGFATAEPDPQDCHVIPNCVARDRERKVWIGAELANCKDFGELAIRRPVEKGYVVNWESERAIWNQTFFGQKAALKVHIQSTDIRAISPEHQQCDPKETNLILTEAPNCPQALQTNCDQMIFEEFEFASYSPALNAYNNISSLYGDHSGAVAGQPVECLLVVDSGYSHTTVTPLLKGQPIQSAIRRLDIGGKFLTNYLKDLISVRHFDVRDEPWLVNEIKEATSFVSQDFAGDLEKTWKGGQRDHRRIDSSIVVDYVLPDYETRPTGIVRPHDPDAARRQSTGPPKEPVITLKNERFSVPELFFNPGDVGMKQAGLPSMILQSVDALPPELRPAMLANVVVVGGNVNIPGFMERLQNDLQQITPSEYLLRIAAPADPVKYTWLGGARMGSSRETLEKVLVTKEEYEDNGTSWLLRRFSNPRKT